MKVIFQKKEDLFPNFGMAKNCDAFVRNDLPKIVQICVIAHELCHLRDKSMNVFWREVKANFVGFVHCPIGFIICCLMSLAPYRLKLYYDRFKKGY